MQSDSNSDLVRATAYDKSKATEYDDYRFTDIAGKAIHDAESRILLDTIKTIPSSGSVLEVGCGTGRLMVEVSKLGYHIDGADASGPMLAEAGAKFVDAELSPEFYLCEAANLSCKEDRYDFCYSIRLLNQTESDEYALAVVRDMIRVTKPGGKCLVEFVNTNRPRWGMNKRPTTRLSPRAVLQTAEANGTRLVEWNGAFFISMQAYKKVPKWALKAASKVDNFLSELFPRLCSRVYLTVEKRD